MAQWTAVVVTLALAGLAGGAAAEGKAGAEDDLALVKKAVARPTPSAAPAATVRTSGRVPLWFKVRVVDKATGHKRVTLNLPLSVVRALGRETIDWGGRDDASHSLRLSDVLGTLEAGQDLVEIDDEDSTVKIWVE